MSVCYLLEDKSGISSLTVAWIAAFVPARRASAMSPIEALRESRPITRRNTQARRDDPRRDRPNRAA
jgi:hypothetical protein